MLKNQGAGRCRDGAKRSFPPFQDEVADEIFTGVMGDVVEPRRDFVQENAVNVANLDV